MTRRSQPSAVSILVWLVALAAIAAPAAAQNTVAPPYLVIDANPGAAGSDPTSLVSMGGVVYYAATDAANGNELWRTDGTPAGTYLVRDIAPGATSSAPTLLTVSGGVLYFAATDGVVGHELWRSDGTEAGTVLVKDVFVGPSNGFVASLTDVNGTLFFKACELTHGCEVWKSDGTEAGTVLVKDILPGSSSSFPQWLTALGNVVLFQATDGVNGEELWKSDGTAAGTVLVKNIDPTPIVSPQDGHGRAYPENMLRVGDTVFFWAYDGVHGKELWKTDGTTAGTVLVKDIRPGSDSGTAFTEPMAASGGRLYFEANDPVAGYELFVSDGTTAGTKVVRDITPGILGTVMNDLTDLEGLLMFASFGSNAGKELWRSDGTSTFTQLAWNIAPFSASSDPVNLRRVRHEVVFAANDGTNGIELWRSRGFGALRISDINPGAASASPGPVVAVAGGGDLVVFAANDGVNGRELWAVALNRRPRAFAGGDQQVDVGAPVTIDGTGSSDPDGDALTYEWRDEADTLLGESSTVTAFLAPGPHVVTLTVSDGEYEDATSINVLVSNERHLTVDVGGNEGGLGSVQVDPPTALCGITTAGTYQTCQYTYDPVTVVTLTPIPAPQSVFLGWYGACEGTGPCQVTMSEHRNAFAMFLGPRLLTIDVGGNEGGMGSVQVTPPNALCGITTPGTYQTCQYAYTQGDVVTLTPIPAPQSVFIGWYGACEGTGPCQVTMSEHKGAFAMFLGPRLLTVDVGGNEGGLGSVQVTPPNALCGITTPGTYQTCQYAYTQGDVVTLTPIPAPGSVFMGWFGICTGTGPCQVTMSDHKGAFAMFLGPRLLTVDVGGNEGGLGSVQVTPPNALCGITTPGTYQTCQYAYTQGDVVTLTPIPAPGSVFMGWFGICTGTGPCQVTMSEHKGAFAMFLGPRTLTVDAVALGNGYGLVEVTPPSVQCLMAQPGQPQHCEYPIYTQGDVVSLQAQPITQLGVPSLFDGWDGACAGLGNPCQVTMSESRGVMARFAEGRYVSLQVQSLDGGRGSISAAPFGYSCQLPSGAATETCVHARALGEVTTLTATPEPGSTFLGWTGACSGTGPCQLTVMQDVPVAAHFRSLQTLTVAVVATGPVTGSVHLAPSGAPCVLAPGSTSQICTYQYETGSNVTLTAVPDPGAAFVQWTGAACQGSGPCFVTMSEAREVQAVFAVPNEPPVPRVNGPYFGSRSQPVVFESTGSSDPEGAPLTYSWEFGDGTFGAGPFPSHTYAAIGTYQVALWVSDGVNTSNAATTTVTIDNNPPIVSLTSPAAGAVYPSPPAFVTITAAATDTDGTITHVELFADGNPIADLAMPPYTFTWSNVGPGTHFLSARVTDNDGATAVTAAVAIIVNAPPTATLMTPSMGALFDAPANIPIEVAASDPDGVVVGVEFIVDGIVRGSDTTSPYTFVWTNAPAGPHEVAVAVADDRGAVSVRVANVFVRGHYAALADSYVRDGSSSSNFGSSSTLNVRTWPGTFNNHWTYLRFDTGSQPTGTGHYTLRLYGNHPSTPMHTQAFGVANVTWSESTITWNNKPATGSTVLADETVTSALGFYEWDVTAYVLAEKAAGRNAVSFALKNLTDSGTTTQFRSRQASSNRPELLFTP